MKAFRKKIKNTLKASKSFEGNGIFLGRSE
jgi:hypothetical protein